MTPPSLSHSQDSSQPCVVYAIPPTFPGCSEAGAVGDLKEPGCSLPATVPTTGGCVDGMEGELESVGLGSTWGHMCSATEAV